MQKNKLNNVIVLKEMCSNIVEEAIVVLKPNINLKNVGDDTLTLNKEKIPDKNKSILKEAEFVIENCISQIEMKKKNINNEKIEKKYKILKKFVIGLLVINFLLLIKVF